MKFPVEMTCHLSHRIPWNLLSSCFSIIYRKHYSESDYIITYIIIPDNILKINHFCRTLADTIKDFSQTFTDEDYQDKYNLNTWDNCRLEGAYGDLGIITSILFFTDEWFVNLLSSIE